MKSSPLFAALALSAPLVAQDDIITLGDSLTYAYEGSFAFQFNIPFADPIGDGFDPNEVKNWVEILDDERNDDFNLGPRDEFVFSIPNPLPFFPDITFNFFFRQEHNWALPGLRVQELREFIEGESDLTEILPALDGFSELASLLAFTNLDPINEGPNLDDVASNQAGISQPRWRHGSGGKEIGSEGGVVNLLFTDGHASGVQRGELLLKNIRPDL